VVSVCLKMELSRRFFFACASRCWNWLPRRELHGPQAGTRLLISWPPPAASSVRWSAVVAWAWPHQWHWGLPWSSARLLALYVGSSYLLMLSGFFLLRGRPLLARAPQGACRHASCRLWCMSPLALSVCLRGGQMFVIVDSHHSRLCRSYAAQAPRGQPALPSSPSVIPAPCKPVRGRACLQLSLMMSRVRPRMTSTRVTMTIMAAALPGVARSRQCH
jgi:hypothetical protein